MLPLTPISPTLIPVAPQHAVIQSISDAITNLAQCTGIMKVIHLPDQYANIRLMYGMYAKNGDVAAYGIDDQGRSIIVTYRLGNDMPPNRANEQERVISAIHSNKFTRDLAPEPLYIHVDQGIGITVSRVHRAFITLQRYLSTAEFQRLDESGRCNIIASILNAVARLNKDGIIHGDLCLSKILLRFLNGIAQMSFIGFTRSSRYSVSCSTLTETASRGRTACFASAEMSQAIKSETFSMGIIAVHLLAHPSPNLAHLDQFLQGPEFQSITKAEKRGEFLSHRLGVPMSPSVRTSIGMMLEPNPDLRWPVSWITEAFHKKTNKRNDPVATSTQLHQKTKRSFSPDRVSESKRRRRH